MSRIGQDWSHGLCSCQSVGSCCGATWCSPFIFGRSAWRLERFPASPDHSAEFSWFNESCLIMTGAWLLAVPWLPVWMQRRRLRQKFGIEGSGCTDCLSACCCNCCAQVQIENELVDRAEESLLQSQQPPINSQRMAYAQSQDIPMAPLPSQAQNQIISPPAYGKC
jgi:Cys-rich protein (TIGR01571 family)